MSDTYRQRLNKPLVTTNPPRLSAEQMLKYGWIDPPNYKRIQQWCAERDSHV